MTDRQPLTDRQDQILGLLIKYVRENHYQPTFAELAALAGVRSVQRVIERIWAKGWIKPTGSPRAIEIPDDVFDSYPGVIQITSSEQAKVFFGEGSDLHAAAVSMLDTKEGNEK